MNDCYVLLTGSKSNAGDFLIRKRVIELLATQRPDRQLINLNAWESLDDERLALVNRSRALILAGGPSLRANMYPGIYPLRPDLDDIRVPVIAMGIGWKSPTGAWSDTRTYPLEAGTLSLLRKINASGHLSSVRDYHTLNVLLRHDFENFRMTGCPALFADASTPLPEPGHPIRRISFSLGVSFLSSRSMERQMKDMVRMLSDRFGAEQVVTVFHHSTSDEFLKTHNASRHHLEGHRKFIAWLNENGLPHVDVSGSAERMIEHYATSDLHVGYRVHAHVLMCSLSKPSLLLAEDGRGTALKTVLGAGVIETFDPGPTGLVARLARDFGIADTVRADRNLPAEVSSVLDNEIASGWLRARAAHQAIETLRGQMAQFAAQLP